ncbi:hypothetical protein P691DRAFT_798405 [Macrolepiota fuliginosa MF-IS2]|uniref:2-dehydropantoate 2-reductase n=1 Tax=Macrolepiota fuliginosa MF-IS2 TaxID=1400762 RepID=A0A9P5XMD1_9AGAR|nr:hypothetical protein P691DRAFT_798405 [Macrolepiota fuliginosa MF-IS2]
MHFHVLGLGSIGTFLAHHLRRALPPEIPITLIHKLRSQAERTLASGNIIRVERNGVVTQTTGFKTDVFDKPLRTSHGPWLPKSEMAIEHEEEANSNQPISSLLVTTKAHQALPAISKLAPLLSADSTIVLLQNGMGLYEELSSKVFRNPGQRPHFIIASNTHGVFTKGFHHVVHAGPGAIDFGIMPDLQGRNFETSLDDESIPPFDRHLQLNDITTPNDPHFKRYKSLRDTVALLLLLQPLHVTWRPMHEMQVILRRKLVVNAVINPLTAIMGCRNGDLSASPATQYLMDSICYEASQAFAAEFQSETNQWVHGLAEQGVDANTIDVTRLPLALTKAALAEEVVKVMTATRGNISSMLMDIRHGNPTEIDYINGYLLKIGRTHRVRMPTNATLLNLVKLRSHIPLDQQL